ncbi:hypothetical protein AZI85_08315 [Bdellovibrio bacteriovorus]|uniref:Uncharacterized protein n=1 Tax=Bdellovibrio bacteriovorus TaxID=959 RepID=A0A150WH18_BDEBC|nr:hypothetical protein [Bdellovibrio bacteriovorus]KYG62185.1 hypothetical protein AZI85_08315 [Bdellovibrio bacteriovorus]
MAFRFDERALAVVSGEVFGNFAAWGSYPVWLALIYKILDTIGLLEYRLSLLYWLNQSFGLGTAYLVYRFLRHLHVASPWQNWVLGLFLLLNPMQIYLNSLNISESLFQFLTVLALGLYFEVFKVSSWTRHLGIFVLLGISFALRNIILPFLLLFSFYALTFPIEAKRMSRKQSLVGFALMVFLLAGLSLLNSRFDRQGTASLNLNRGANIAQAWCQAPTLDFKNEQNSFWFRPPSFWSLRETRSLFLENDFRDTFYYVQTAKACVQERPWVAALQSRSLLNIFDGPFYPDPMKGRMTTLSKIFSGLYLLIFLCTLFYISQILSNPITRLFLLFILCQCAAVFFSNPGEARFIYSFLPVLAINFAYIANQNLSKLQRPLSLGAVLTALLLMIPSSDTLIRNFERNLFSSKSMDEKLTELETRLNFVSARSADHLVWTTPGVCKDVLPKILNCLETSNNCEEKNLIKAYREVNSQPMTEEELFCRNLTMTYIRDHFQIHFPLDVIQKPSPLPGGVENNHPLVAIAGQLLHADLALQANMTEAIPESYESLLYQLTQYQHRTTLNRAEYLGTVVENLQKAEPSQKAQEINRATLQTVLQSLRSHPSAISPLTHQE